MTQSRALPVAAVLLVLAATALVYRAGLSGGFVLDDFHNIVENSALQGDQWNLNRAFDAATSRSAGPLGRPIANFSFALDAWGHGLNPYYMKAVNLFLHGLTGILVFLIARRIIGCFQDQAGNARSDWPAVLAAALWLLHPIQTSAVLYVVQRMAILAALFGSLSIFAYLKARQAEQTRAALAWLGVHMAALGLAAYSKENGLLVLPLVVVIEACVFRLRNAGWAVNPYIRGYVYAVAAGCVAAAVYALVFLEAFTGAYVYRDFSLWERLLTEARVIWHYLGLLVAPIPNHFSLYKDGFTVSEGLLAPTSTAFAVAGLIAVSGWALWRTLKGPSLIAFGILWFLVAHAFESTIIPLEIIFEHRNYLPSAGLAIAFSGILAVSGRALLGNGSQAAIGGLSVALVAFCTFVISTYWSDPVDFVLVSVEQHPESPRAQYAAGTIYSGLIREQGPVEGPEDLMRYVSGAKRAEKHFQRAAELAPNAIAPYVQLIILFGDVPASDQLLKEMHQRLATARLRPAAGDELYRLLQCNRRGDCGLEPEPLLKAITAATDNPNARIGVRATCHLLAASILATELSNRAAAEKHIKAARRLLPDDRNVRAEVERFYQAGATR